MGALGGFVLASERALPELTRFRVMSRIGAGASGTVYRAQDRRSGEVVALKVLHEGSAAAQRGLQAEFEALHELDHPNLVKLHEVGSEDGVVFVAMELIEGVDFVRFVRPRPYLLDEQRLRSALVQCVVGLDQLHAIGKVHRDIKPGNVRVTNDGRVVILDFGLLADAHAGMTVELSDNLQAGTAAYMAPEQAVGDPVSPATDLYALGVMLYQALTGELPFSGTAHEMRVAKVSSAAPRARVPEGACEDLERLCAWMLAMRPGDRPDVRQMLTALNATDRIRDRSRPASLPPVSRMPFVGRTHELSRIEQLALAPKAHTAGLHLLAKSGMGKTALLGEARRRLETLPEVVWLEGRAHSPQRLPFEPLVGVIDSLAQWLLRIGVRSEWLIDGCETMHELFPALRRVARIPHRLGPPSVPDRLERRWRGLSALRHLLLALARERPVVMCIDDFHHIDLDSRRVIERLFLGPDSPPLLLLLASEPESNSIELEERQVLVLDPLSLTEVTELAGMLTRDEEDAKPLVERAARISSGCPLLLLELLRLCRRDGSRAELPERLELATRARYQGLAPDARDVLDVIALVGVPLPLGILAIALGRSASDISRAAAQLTREGFLWVGEPAHDVLCPTHDGLLNVCLGFLTAERRNVLVPRLCDALSGVDLSFGAQLVNLSMESERAELAADAAFRLSKAAIEVLAMDRAATYHSLAAELTQKKDALVQYSSARLLAETLADAGRSVEAAYAYQLAYQTSNAANALDLHRRSAELFVHSGHMEEAGLSCIREALETVGEDMPESFRSAALSLFKSRAWVWMRGLSFEERTIQQVSARDLTRIDVMWAVGATLGLVDHLHGAALHLRGLIHALKAGEPLRIARALALEAAFLATTEPAPQPRVEKLLERAEALCETRRVPYADGLLALSRGMVSWARSDHLGCCSSALSAEATFRTHCADVLWETTTAQTLVIANLATLGRFRELSERAQRYQQEALERGSRHAHASFELYGGFARFLCLDDPKNARARVREALACLPRQRFVLQHMGELTALAWIDSYEQGPIDEKRVAAAREGAKQSHLLSTFIVRDAIYDSQARVAVQKAQRGRSHAKEAGRELLALARSIRSLAMPASEGRALFWTAHARALLEGDAEVPSLLAEAERRCSEVSAYGLAWAIAYRRGRVLGGDEGRALVRDISERFKAEGVRNPTRLVNAFAPNFGGNE
jgi:serine/threonine protein kinase